MQSIKTATRFLGKLSVANAAPLGKEEPTPTRKANIILMLAIHTLRKKTNAACSLSARKISRWLS